MHTEVYLVSKPNKKEKERETSLQQKVQRHDRNSEKKKAKEERGRAHRSCAYAALLELLKGRSRSLGSLDELKLRLATVHAVRL